MEQFPKRRQFTGRYSVTVKTIRRPRNLVRGARVLRLYLLGGRSCCQQTRESTPSTRQRPAAAFASAWRLALVCPIRGQAIASGPRALREGTASRAQGLRRSSAVGRLGGYVFSLGPGCSQTRGAGKPYIASGACTPRSASPSRRTVRVIPTRASRALRSASSSHKTRSDLSWLPAVYQPEKLETSSSK